MAKNEIAVKNESTEMVPDFLKNQGSARGTEEVTASDLIIPRLEVIQSLSPARKKTDPAYIEGAEEGMLFNNVTRTLYGESVTVVPVYFRKQHLLWKDRKLGGGSGGFRGAFPTSEAAKQHLLELGEENIDIVETAEHFCLLLDGDKIEEVVLSMAKSKMKVSRKWNSIIRINGGDSFARTYKVSGVSELNAKGEEFYNMSVANGSYVTEPVYRRAEALYEQIKAGMVKADNNIEQSSSPDSSEF